MILTEYGEKQWFVWGCDYIDENLSRIMGKTDEDYLLFLIFTFNIYSS